MIPEELWGVIQSALDARKDPLDEPRVCEHLLNHPADLSELERLSDRLSALSAVPDVEPLVPAGTGAPQPTASRDSADEDTTASEPPWAQDSRPRGIHWPWKHVAALLFIVISVGSWLLLDGDSSQQESPWADASLVDPSLALADPLGDEPQTKHPAVPPAPAAITDQAPTRVLSWSMTMSTIDAFGTTVASAGPSGFSSSHRSAAHTTENPVRSFSIAWTDL